ncbi:MAG: AI-2E family transporter [Planctomycetaceae bacterium]|nr:MAG: AI-2E family transporter [Planctomycetaceae bacterium]
MANNTTTTESHWILPLASIVVVVAALHFAKALLIPLTLAALLSFLLSPVCDWLEQRRLARIPAVLGTALLGFVILGFGAWAATRQVSQLVPMIPEYSRNVEQRLGQLNVNVVSILQRLTRSGPEPDDDRTQPDRVVDGSEPEKQSDSVQVVSALAGSLESYSGMFGTLLEILGTIGIIIVLVIFFMARREDLRDRFIHLMGENNLTLTTRMLEDANTRVRRYISMLFLINATFGIGVGVGLFFIGVPSALLWGIVAATLRFVPYIGPWVAAALPIGLSFAITTGWTIPLLTIGLFVVLELLSNNVMEPLLYGRNTGVSAVAVLVAALFWMWLWGPIGLLLATPLTVCVLVVGKHIPRLSFFETLLGSDPVFEPKTRIYQRLLAGDQAEAEELVKGFLKRQPLLEVYDSVLLPAIVINEKHWQLEELFEDRYRCIMRCFREMIGDCGDRPRPPLANEDANVIAVATDAATGEAAESGVGNDNAPRAAEHVASPLDVVCLPAHTESDELTALMLVQVLTTPETSARSVSIESLAGDLAERIAAEKADVICVCATPPVSVMHARNLCKQIRDQLPHVKLIACLWDTSDALDATTERFGHDAVVVATMAEAQEQIRQLITAPSATTEQPAEIKRDRIARPPADALRDPLVSV